MKLIAVGDNVTDCYLDEKVFYPGGNAVNVAVNCKRNGAEEAAYLGVFGSDVNARHIQECLKKEGVSFDRSRTVDAPSGQPGVTINGEGDRIFVKGPRRTAQTLVKLQLLEDDLEYIGGFDICHTSCFSSIEDELPALSGKCGISYDFSDEWDEAYLRRVCPWLKIAFFSGSDMTDAGVAELQSFCHGLGVRVVGVTLGGRGACVSENGRAFRQGIVPTEVVDTMGAGDSFIAGFLTEYGRGADMPAALAYAAGRAANTCRQHGGWGYPHPFVTDWPGNMTK
jgi:fructoselysine 6-kinase